MSSRPDLGVVLFQLGGPDSLEAVEPFLFNLFSDPDIIDFPFARLARPTLARLAARHRAAHARRHYAEIGGRSPIRELTERQAAALERELRLALDAHVWVAMRYWHPLTEDVVRAVASADPGELVLLPMYPQYSKTTSGSSLNEWRRQWARLAGRPRREKVIREFYSHPGYLDAVAERINDGLARFPAREAPTLVFSAHGIPMSDIEAGDPYQRQVEETVALVIERGGWPNPHTLCYQSKVGPGRWTEPLLPATLKKLAAEGARNILVIPIAFVTDHVETLHEIDLEARAEAKKLGLGQFELMPALNNSPLFIRALAELVLRTVRTAVPAQVGRP
jgi:ferrochelatase